MDDPSPAVFEHSLSLAAAVRRIGRGSSCFCCGAEMRSPRSGGRLAANGEVVAECPRCGSEVAACEEQPGVGTCPGISSGSTAPSERIPRPGEGSAAPHADAPSSPNAHVHAAASEAAAA